MSGSVNNELQPLNAIPISVIFEVSHFEISDNSFKDEQL